MSWNKPSTNQPMKKKGGGKAPSALKGLLVGVLAVAIGATCVWLFSGGNDEIKDKAEKERGRIKEVTPAAAPKFVEKEKPVVKKTRKEIDWKTVDTNGFNEATMRKWRFENRRKPSITNDVAKTHPKMKCEIFDTYEENAIAVLMTLEPGQSLVGIPNYGGSFERGFLKSCEVPIIVKPEDDEYTRQLKKDMNEVKIELRQRMANGESLNDILTEARKEAMRLGQIKEEVLSSTRAAIRAAEANGEDPNIYYEAANKMLEKNGIAPMKPNAIYKRLLKRRINDGGQF